MENKTGLVSFYFILFLPQSATYPVTLVMEFTFCGDRFGVELVFLSSDSLNFACQALYLL